MDAVDAVAGALFEDFVEFLEESMVDFQLTGARTADQVMVGMAAEFIDKLAAADVRSQNQTLGGQEIQGAVNRGFGQAGQGSAGRGGISSPG